MWRAEGRVDEDWSSVLRTFVTKGKMGNIARRNVSENIKEGLYEYE